MPEGYGLAGILSTPHGALGTTGWVGAFSVSSRLSTPHGALGTFKSAKIYSTVFNFQLHTVH